MKATKLAPIFLKNFRPENKQKGKEAKKKRGRSRKQETGEKCEIVIDGDDDSLTEFYFNEEAENFWRKKFKSVTIEDDADVKVLDEAVIDTNSCSNDVWTNKYKDSAFKDRICCRESFSELYVWLTDWKSSQSGSQASIDSGDEYRSCLLIYGPPGSGKTSLVYAVADELNFKVFEVNCSSRRNGKAITERLKEATESLTINRNKSRVSEEVTESQTCVNLVKTSERKPPGGTLLQFFKKSDNKNKHSMKSTANSSDCSLEKQPTEFNDSTVSNISITSDSLLLFDDVDVLFEEDDGFWRAVNTLVESGKPVLLTASHSLESIRTFVSDVKILQIKPPSSESLLKLLRDVASQENIVFPEETSDNVVKFDGDIRRCLNELQFYGTRFLNNDVSKECDCDELFSPSVYECGNILDSLLTYANIVNITQRRDMFMQAFPLQVPDINWQLFNSIHSEINYLSLKVHKHWDCKFNSTKVITPFVVNEDTQELLNVRTLIPCNPNISSLTVDYLPYLYEMCTAEDQRRKQFIADARRCRRFYHYFDSISFFITDKFKQVLMNHFSSRQ